MKPIFIKIKTTGNIEILINIDDISTVCEVYTHRTEVTHTSIVIKGRDCDNDDICYRTYTNMKAIQEFLSSEAKIFEFVEQKR